MQIIDGKLDYGSIAKDSNGGTEVMARRVASLSSDLLKEFQIVVSRMEEPLDPTKIRVYYVHDLPEQSNEHLRNDGHNKFHRLVFVSNWQMQFFINAYQIPWSKCIVMQNAIDPIEWYTPGKEDSMLYSKFDKVEKVKLIYHTTPHRGLEILVPVFNKICETHDVELDVFSSFELYGWPQRDEQFQPLFDACNAHPKITYHGTKDNETVRKALQQAHIFAYPSIWPETSCLSLMEAMSAGCISVHSNYGALYETAANWTHMYHYNEDRNEHAKVFYTVLTNAIDDVQNEKGIAGRLKTQKAYADIFYAWDPNRRKQWEALLTMLLDQVKDRAFEKDMFVYRT
jgi:UDP-glucose:(glucosyl)LPS alpha-1,2-glucosyltransferase